MRKQVGLGPFVSYQKDPKSRLPGTFILAMCACVWPTPRVGGLATVFRTVKQSKGCPAVKPLILASGLGLARWQCTYTTSELP